MWVGLKSGRLVRRLILVITLWSPDWALAAGGQSDTEISVEQALRLLDRRWNPERVALLRAALDPDSDGLIARAEWDSFVGAFTGSTDPTCDDPPPPGASPVDASTALSAEPAPTFSFFRGAAPQKPREDSAYYFRPHITDVDEPLPQSGLYGRCAERCLGMGLECWFFSINEQYRSCNIHVKWCSFTSFTIP
mgnify:CR=1 FL=1